MRVAHLADTSGLCGCGCGAKTDIATRNNAARGWKRGEPKRALRGHRVTPRSVTDPATRFWSHVDKTETCWIWTGAKRSSGHGLFRVAPTETMKGAHRFSWELANGPIPAGMAVCHNCPGGDNPSCVNPAHLFLGSQSENVRDCVSKKRMPVGSQRAGAKLDAADVARIRSSAAEGRSYAELAREFGVSKPTIRSIVLRKKWKGVP